MNRFCMLIIIYNSLLIWLWLKVDIFDLIILPHFYLFCLNRLFYYLFILGYVYVIYHKFLNIYLVTKYIIHWYKFTCNINIDVAVFLCLSLKCDQFILRTSLLVKVVFYFPTTLHTVPLRIPAVQYRDTQTISTSSLTWNETKMFLIWNYNNIINLKCHKT